MLIGKLPRAITALLIANVAAFLLQFVLRGLAYPLMLWPIDIAAPWQLSGRGFLPWQLLTYGFLHADLGHLFFNMLALVMFGSQLEHRWGHRKFLIYYLVCVLAAGLCQLLLASIMVHQGDAPYPTLGASGGVYGVVLAFGLLFPNEKIMVFPLPFFVRARTVAIVFALGSLFYGIIGVRDGIAHFAHLGGMLGGWLLLRYWQGGGPRRRAPPPRTPTHLRRVK